MQIKDMALEYKPWRWDPKAAAKAANPDRRRKWLIPLVLLAQVAIKLLLDRCGGVGRGCGVWAGFSRGPSSPAAEPCAQRCVQGRGVKAREGGSGNWGESEPGSESRGRGERRGARSRELVGGGPGRVEPGSRGRGRAASARSKALRSVAPGPRRRVMEEDGVKGDANGPFDPETVKERREELRRDKVGCGQRVGWRVGSRRGAGAGCWAGRPAAAPLRLAAGVWQRSGGLVGGGGLSGAHKLAAEGLLKRFVLCLPSPACTLACSCESSAPEVGSRALTPRPRPCPRLQEEKRRQKERERRSRSGGSGARGAAALDESEEEEEDDY